MSGQLTHDQTLVTILIATKDRPSELRRTLQVLRNQTWSAIELVVIDDGSKSNLASLVAECWPEATFVRKEQSSGQSKRRSEGFLKARGKYILQLDDDSAPVEPEALERAVQFLEGHPGVGILSFYIFNGADLPESLPRSEARYAHSFVGCGALLRAAALRQTAGYRDFFGNEWEEEELAIQVLKAGWAIYFFPEVLIHHLVSARNRNSARTWSRGLRNKLWSLIMHMPARQLPLEVTWVLAVGFYDSIRMMRVGWLMRALWQCALGLPRAIGLRAPMSPLVLRRYNALRFRGVTEANEFETPARIGLADLRTWYRAWRDRPRQRSVWDRRPGDVGRSATVYFEHNDLATRESADATSNTSKGQDLTQARR